MPRHDDDDDRDDMENRDDDDDREPVRNRRSGEPSNDDRQMAMFCHLGGLLGLVLPLVIWLTQKDKSDFVDQHGKEAVNFGITMMIGHVVGIFVTCGILSFILLPLTITFCIIASSAANRGEDYKYPICIRFIT